MHVCVLGAGIVGLASAYALRQAGHEVTVVDQSTAGSGASGGNGAQLSYAYVQPLADPAIWRQLPKLLLSPASPLKLRPQLDVHQWLWGLKFLAACNADASHRATVQLLQLAGESRMAFDAMMQREQLACDFSDTGKLVLYPNEESFGAARRQLKLQQALGSVQEAVSADRCVEIEPALAHQQRHIHGAIYTPGECAADCQKTCDGLLAALQSQGVKFLLNTPVSRLVTGGNAMQAVCTPQGDVQADRFVLALGAAAAPFARQQLGVHLPIYPLKGYSITLDLKQQEGLAPRVSVTDSARKLVFARIGQRLRVAGMAELGGYNTAIDPVRIASLKASTEEMFPACGDSESLSPWAGLRPATPTGLPIVGRHPKGPENLIFNCGHGALGFTLAFGSAARLPALLA